MKQPPAKMKPQRLPLCESEREAVQEKIRPPSVRLLVEEKRQAVWKELPRRVEREWGVRVHRRKAIL